MNISYTLTTCGRSFSWLRTRKCLVVNKEGSEGEREADEGWGAGGRPQSWPFFCCGGIYGESCSGRLYIRVVVHCGMCARVNLEVTNKDQLLHGHGFSNESV